MTILWEEMVFLTKADSVVADAQLREVAITVIVAAAANIDDALILPTAIE